MTLEAILLNIREKLSRHYFKNEASVTQGAFLPVMQTLGWPIFDTDVVRPQKKIQTKQGDFSLHWSHAPIDCIVEVKAVGKFGEGIDQVLDYAMRTKVGVVVLTDGRYWRFYVVNIGGTSEERMACSFNLERDNIPEIMKALRRYLSYNEMSSGRALENLRLDQLSKERSLLMEKAIHNAWEDVLAGSPLFLQCFSDMIYGKSTYFPTKEDMLAFLKKKSEHTEIEGNKDVVAENFSKAADRVNHITTTSSLADLKPVLMQTFPNFKVVAPKPLAKPQPKPVTVQPTPVVPVTTVSTNTQNPVPKFEWIGIKAFGQTHTCKSDTDVMVAVFNEIAQRQPSAIQKISNDRKNDKRKLLATNPLHLYENPLLCKAKARKLNNNWYIGINETGDTLEKILRNACQVAGFKLGDDIEIHLRNRKIVS